MAGGVLALTRQLAVEYAASGVRVNAISPVRRRLRNAPATGQAHAQALATG